MSIIQEALKKSKVNGADTRLEKPDISLKSPNIFFIVLFLAAAVFAVKWLTVTAPADKAIAEKSKSAEVRVTRSDELVTGALRELATPMRHVKSAFEGNTQVYPNLALNGIMYLAERPQAIINDSVVTVGDTVGGAKVTRINNSSVLLNYNGLEITLTLTQ